MNLSDSIKYYPLGDHAVVLCFGDVISKEINNRIRNVAACMDNMNTLGIIEYVPAYTTITIYYDPLIIGYEAVLIVIQHLLENIPSCLEQQSLEKIIPVFYNGPDLADVARYTGLSQEQVIRIHSESEYLVYMIGFAPGFPYLGGMDKRIATPRKEVPRLKIEAGSVGIAGEQTGVYPMETPGGWQIIGQTPLQLFNMNRDEPSFLGVGDRVRFEPIGYDEFLHIRKIENGG